ncbi:MAG: hydrogenase maturation protease [Deltaproteobacteria bacterium]|nr:hydrogenase maturation protease [Deltaproteobacteria bacterium]
MPTGKVVVLGVGNLIMGDEGLGIRCIEQLDAAGSLPAGVVTIDGGTSTHELLGDLEDLDLLVIVDAVAGGTPGAVVRLEGDRIPQAFSNKLSPHQHGINDLLANLRLLGREPGRVVVLGVTPKVIALGMDLSPEVAAVMPELRARVVAEVSGS